MDQIRSPNNAINNYKGVMLCSRPNEAIPSLTEKYLISDTQDLFAEESSLNNSLDQFQPNNSKLQHSNQRVFEPFILEPRLEILDRHKKWLNHFKKDIENKNKQIEQNRKKDEQKMKRIKELAENDRQRAKKMKNQYNQTAANVLNILNQNEPLQSENQLTAQNLNKINKINELEQTQNMLPLKAEIPEKNQNIKRKKKNLKPLWAQTQEQIQKNQDQEVDELLDFFSTNHVQDYAQNNQVKQILSNLKQKIQKLKEQVDWKQKQMDKINKRKEDKKKSKEQQDSVGDNEDKITHFSEKSDGKSVASEKTQRSYFVTQKKYNNSELKRRSSRNGTSTQQAKNPVWQTLMKKQQKTLLMRYQGTIRTWEKFILMFQSGNYQKPKQPKRSTNLLLDQSQQPLQKKNKKQMPVICPTCTEILPFDQILQRCFENMII